MRKTLSVIALVSTFAACSEKGKVVVADPPAPAKHAAVVAAPQPVSLTGTPPQAGGRIAGRILETMNAGGYTYIRIGTPTGDVWTAVRETKVKKGATIAIDTQMVAENFESATLKRKFDRIVMGVIADTTSTNQSGGTAAPAEAGAPSAMGTPRQHMTSASSLADVNVEKAPGGKTIAEMWAEKKDLADKRVVIRGRIVKFLPGIMGKNWIHIRDGSGSREQANDDITVTTRDVAKIGDVVTVTGTLRVDKDFGAGYHYPVIVEDATLRRDGP